MYVATLHRGPAHVVVAANEDFRAIEPGRDFLGMPAREAFPEPEYIPLHRLMDDCYRTGREQWTMFHGRLYGVLPRKGGVATVYQLPDQLRPRALRPELVRAG